MEEDPPPPDDPADARTATQRRGSGGSESSDASTSSIITTRTLHSSDLTTVTENSRIYPNSSYFMPCDAAEQTRLSILHQVYLSALSGALTTAPITAAVTRILDLGTGPGDWAVGIAESFPYADVVGIDLAVWDVEAVEPGEGVGGVRWEIDDLDIWSMEGETDESRIKLETLELEASKRGDQEQHGKQKHIAQYSPEPPHFDPYTLESSAEPPIGWDFSEPFDFIHVRGLKGAFANWAVVYEEIYKSLAPGGWVEIADYEIFLPEPDDSTAPASSSATGKGKSRKKPPLTFPNVRALYHATHQASRVAGKTLGTAYISASMLEAAGFSDVRSTQVNVPVGTWHEDEKQKAIGKLFLVCVMEGLEATCLRLLTRYGGEGGSPPWSAEQVREACEKAKQELLKVGTVRDNGGGKRHVVGEGWCAQFKWAVGRRSRSGH
ncbi:hypothetical protein AOQ84DRAFT_295358 [Glonium stellatum]|uniref:S-adenosyl-L-methionine-dependent methyltransferase n=1 Tax=Glonium stellatum TaxID=574774 RepID=A0A8E2EYL0_9PEZI|nr:hypothetical protein AOQ84DRAFT_295358 [Glonium stellatum]